MSNLYSRAWLNLSDYFKHLLGKVIDWSERRFFPLEETAAQTIILTGFIRRKAILAPAEMLAILLAKNLSF